MSTITNMSGLICQTYVSLTPQMLDEPLAMSMIKSESMSIPPAAPGTTKGTQKHISICPTNLTILLDTHSCRS